MDAEVAPGMDDTILTAPQYQILAKQARRHWLTSRHDILGTRERMPIMDQYVILNHLCSFSFYASKYLLAARLERGVL
ncbi:hypothetical protein KSX_63220 [Ktedonospora formicarum]|uniref:Uncharacterized protein n=1 Tax=Ktedonospora formicarum TaxID=2778364 RepID=A0A8J3IB93_9CHLR|nr:hypothetical protein KSX_63220 [Ktedonospora formicarum]